MIRLNNHRQVLIFDPRSFPGGKRPKPMDASWAGIFQKEILPILPVKELFPFFSDSSGRPAKDLCTVTGVLILQQASDLTDQETVEQLSFNIQWQYALNITEQSDEAAYISLKTLWNNRGIMSVYHLGIKVFRDITDKLRDVSGADITKQRPDSVHIRSDMRKSERIRIFSETVHRFLINLKRSHETCFAAVDEEIINRCLTEKAPGCFSGVRPSGSPKTPETVGNDLYTSAVQSENDPGICGMNTCKLLCRFLNGQCDVTGNTVTPKASEDISSDSLRNPSDPDAACRGHKGQGFHAQIMETYAENKDGTVPNPITHAEAEPAHISDAHVLIPAPESVKERDMKPDGVPAATLYGSNENIEKAGETGTETISPVTGGAKRGTLQAFNLSGNGHAVRCPQGCLPVKIRKRNGRYGAVFKSPDCPVRFVR